MQHHKVLLSLASIALFMPLFGTNASASKLPSKVPSQLRGTWYTRESNGVLDKYTITKKNITSSSLENGKKSFSQKSSITTSTRSTFKPRFIVRKGSHGWYGISWMNANGIWSVKRGTYKLSGHKYSVLFNNETGMTPPIKKISMNVGFKHAQKKAHTTNISAKGMVH